MLEGLAAWVLKAYIGKYVNVNAHKLSVGLLSGIVELDNVPLISEAFNDNDLPFELKFGYVGKIKLNLSLNSLRYTPWVLTAENLFIIIGPKRTFKQNIQKSNNNESLNSEKLEKLINLENKWFKEVEFLGIINSTGGEEQSKLFSIFGPMAYSLLQNLQVNLNQFHVRYEDELNQFSLGANIESISIQTDTDIVKTYDPQNKNLSFKSCEVNNFNVYSDTRLLYAPHLEAEKIFELMAFSKLNTEPNYIIQPTSLKSQIIRDTITQPLRKRYKPRIKITSALKEFHLNVNHIHLKYVSHLLRQININKNRLMSRNLPRPECIQNEPIDSLQRKENIRAWWQYLIKCVQLQIKKPTMKDFIKWSTDVNIYKKIYQSTLKKRFAASQTVELATEEETQPQTQPSVNSKILAICIPEVDLGIEQRRIETEWEFRHLVKLRRLIFENFIKSSTFKDYLVKSKLSKTAENLSTVPTSNYLNVYGYMSWRLTNLRDYYFSKAPEVKQETTAHLDEGQDQTQHNSIDDEVLALINDSIENDSLLRRDTLLASLEFKLDEASILLSSDKIKIAELKFHKSTFLFEAMPRHDSFYFQMSLGSFYLYDCTINFNTIQKNYFPIVVYPKNNDIESTDLASSELESVFLLAYEHNSISQTSVNRRKFQSANLEIKSCGLDIIYNLSIIEGLKRFFEIAHECMKKANSVKIRRFKLFQEEETIKVKQTPSSSLNNENSKETINLISASPFKNLSLDFEINAPKFIFPQDFHVPNPLVVIFDFGRFAFKNRDKNRSSKENSSSTLKKSKTESLFNVEKIELEKRRNSVSKIGTFANLEINNENEVSTDEEEVYETPSSSPPPQLENVFIENLSKKTDLPEDDLNTTLDKFYLTYDLHLNELQTVIGHLNSDHLHDHLKKGHSNLHLLEKFDIAIQIDICKFKLKNASHLDNDKTLTPLKINISLNLLKLHVDDLKLVNIYKTFEDLQRTFQIKSTEVPGENISLGKSKSSDDLSSISNVPLEFLESTVDHKEFESSLLTYVSLNVNEIDMTISINKMNEDQLINIERKSICELKIYNVNSEVMSNISGNQLVKFKIVGLLLIDARQIYGTDYQLLAASHNQVELDSKTGRIMDRFYKPRKSLHEVDLKSTLNPLINIDLVIKKNNYIKEYTLKSSFSTFDIILNPETISEIIMLFYSSYLSISKRNEFQFTDIQAKTRANEAGIEPKILNRIKISFEFTRLTVQLFKIVSFEKANKIALFSMNGTSFEATILPGIKYQKLIAKIKGLKISNLNESLKIKSNQKSLFGIGLQNDQEFSTNTDSSDVFNVIYKKSIDKTSNNNKKLVSELKIQMASLCYLHSPEFINDLQCCFKDFMRFQAKTIENITERALDMFKKGTTFLQNTIADIYQVKEKNLKSRSSKIKVKILLQTPVIALPMSAESDQLLIAHLGHITINNNVTNHELSVNRLDSHFEPSFEQNFSDSTKFEVNLKNVRLFTIDLEKEKNYLKAEYEKYKGFKSKSHEKVFVIENFFQIYYEPKCSDKLIDETDVILSLNYLPRFSSYQSSSNIDGGSVRVSSKINVCKIMLSKIQLEQVIKTLDNIVYDDCEVKTKTNESQSTMIFHPTNKSANIVFSPSKTIFNQTEYINEIPKSPKLYTSSFKTMYTKFSELNDELKSELNINVRFKIDKLQINFLADVEQPSQDVAELCFNDYELNILRHEKHVKFINMTLKSLCLVDKLKKSKLLDENKIDDKNIFLLKSFSSVKSSQIKHSCVRSKKNEYISTSVPDISSGGNYFNAYVNCESFSSRNKQLNNFSELAKFYEKLSSTLSTSLPSQIPKFAKEEYQNEKLENQKIDIFSNNYPSTPPPSPSKLKRDKNFMLIKSESMSNLNKENDLNESINSGQMNNSFVDKKKKCLGCVQQNMPLVSIKLIFIDRYHPKFKTKYLSFNRVYKVKFSDLHLNVNPETWIILLDMLGLGSKVYSLNLVKEESSSILNEKLSSYRFLDKDHPFKEDQDQENKPSTYIEFEVEHFAIQLNKSVSSSQLSQMRVKNVLTVIETRYDYLKTNVTLGSLEIYDISQHKGLYSDRFLTSGKQALEFEFFKIQGPPDILCTREYDNSFKLKMSSVKYVHTQRFLTDLTGYFQQFTQLQDALGRMRALSIGQKNISCVPQRGSRIKLDIHAETPIFILPVNSHSRDALVLKLGNIKVENKFLRAKQEGTLSFDSCKHAKSNAENEELASYCLLDLISIQFTDTDIHSAVHFKKAQYEIDERPENNSSCKSQVEFNNFLFKQHSGSILEKKSYLFLQLEHNLESEISHKSPDWQVHVKLNSFLFLIDLQQYILVRGILDKNIGEKILEKSQPTFLMPNTMLETVLSGEIWKCVSIQLDLENVSIELLNNHSIDSKETEKISQSILKRSSLAYLAFLKSSLTYESYSDQSKQIHLVSNEIRIIDKNSSNEIQNNLNPNIFTDILCNPAKLRSSSSDNLKGSNLQLEIHFRSNKISNRYSVLINNCRVIAVFDWLLKVKHFLVSNYDSSKEEVLEEKSFETIDLNETQAAIQNPIEIKINLNNTDLVLVENTSDPNSQAVILRLTAYVEYNQRKINRLFESCLQSVELFSCQMSAIEQTALSIIDPVTFSIFLTAKNSPSLDDEFNNIHSDEIFKLDYILAVSTDKLKLRFSYLDYKLFIKLIESISKQLELSNQKQVEKKELAKSSSYWFFIHSLELSMENFCICIIDDCKDVDIPLTDIQFNHMKMVHFMKKDDSNMMLEQGSAEFGLNVDYYNRLLSGWEPLVEPWLARLNWKIKNNKNCFTLTSMDILNVNITNPFIDCLSGVLANWKDEYNNKSIQYSKRHKIFQPYKLLNLTGEQFQYCTFKDTNSVALNSNTQKFLGDKTTSPQLQDLDIISSDWVKIDDKAEQQFNFYEISKQSKSNSMHSNHRYAQRAHNTHLRELVQHRIRVKLDDWSEIKPLTIDKVGNYFRDIYRLNKSILPIISNNVTRLIFDISLSGNATKLIKVKSPVSIKNRLNYKIQCRIEPFFQKSLTRLGPLIIEIEIDGEKSIPIKYLPCNIWFRPLELGVNKEAEFSSSFTNCNEVIESGQVEYFQLSCKISSSSENFIKPATNSLNSILGCEFFYFFVKIKRHSFPCRLTDVKHSPNSQTEGHFISIEPAFILFNLLPVEFRYKFISTNSLIETSLSTQVNNLPIKQKKIETLLNGKLDANKSNYFSNINVNNTIDLLLDIDNFRMVKSIEISPSKHLINLNKTDIGISSKDVTTETANSVPSPRLSNKKLTINRRVNFFDEKNRPLFLIARIIFKIGTGLISKNKYAASIQKNKKNNNEYFNPCPITIHIQAIYCFFNLTGLPLIFRQYNCDESAGQLEEHEMARSNQPLLFSFNQTDSPYACSMRIGKYCNDLKSYFYNFNKNKKSLPNKMNVSSISDTIIPKWSKPFGLEGGSSYRALHVINNTIYEQSLPVSSDSESSSSTSYLQPDWVYYIGIEIKQGKGLLKDTSFVYFSTRYYLVNKSSENLLIAQYFSIQCLREQNANFLWENLNYTDKILVANQGNINGSNITSSQETDNCITLLNDSMTQFHWPRTDRDQFLSLRLKSNSDYNWSGGFKIDNVDSFYLNLRHKYKSNKFLFLKVEVILDGGTFFIVFSDTNDFPPPITVQNMSQVPLYFFQSQSIEEKYSITVKPNQKLDYSWDEPILEKKLTIGVKGGTSEYLDFSLLEDKKYMYYENFTYIVFSNGEIKPDELHSSLNSSEFVLTAANSKVFIERKESGNRAQLWHLTADGYVIHEGSSSPKELSMNNANIDVSNRFVLDIDDVAPRPSHFTQLTLRRPDTRRNNTQRWSFQADNQMCCLVKNMCVLIEGDFQSNARVGLGSLKNISSGYSKINISKQKLRPGSGQLSVEMFTDGPTRVLKVLNVNEKSYMSINWETMPSQTEVKKVKKSLESYINLTGGIGLSLVHWIDQEYEELLYSYLKSIEIAFDQDEIGQKLMVNVQTIQICNQLIDSVKHNLLYIQNSQSFQTIPSFQSSHSDNQLIKKLQPALHMDFLRLFKYENIITIKHLIVKLFDVNLQVEEKLLWKIIQMLGFDKIDHSTFDPNISTNKNMSKTSSSSLSFKPNKSFSENDLIDSDPISLNYYKSRINSLIATSKAMKFSFNKLQIDRIGMTLSVYKTAKLSPELLKIKSSLGINLIQFENARIDLKAFILMNEHDTASCMLNLIKKHYAQALRENAIRILGSVDFLGNPLGFVVDFKESLSNVLSNGQVTDFVFSVTNSVANSVSKFSGFLSDELNEFTLDERHRETRDQIRNVYNNGSIDHFVGGALGFAVGIVGGALSLATQTYRGFYENGVSGAFAGLGKGAVGTVSKPIVGMLDFTNGIASAIRETSKTNYKMEVSRVRESRCCATPGALLTPFSRSDSEGQKILYQVNSFNLIEKYISMEQLNENQSETIISIITNHRVIFIRRSEYEYLTSYEATYTDLKSSSAIEEDGKIFLEIILENEDTGLKSQRFIFENKQLASSLANKIRFAKADFDETLYSLTNHRDTED